MDRQEMLAFTKVITKGYENEKTGMVLDNHQGSPGSDDSNAYIDKMMAEDRKQ